MFHRGLSLRKFSTPQKVNLFDRLGKLKQRERAAASPQVEDHDFLKEEIGFRVADRILDIKRKMNTLVDIGSGRGFVPRHITTHSFDKVIATEMSPTYLEQMTPPEDEGKKRMVIFLGMSSAKICDLMIIEREKVNDYRSQLSEQPNYVQLRNILKCRNILQ